MAHWTCLCVLFSSYYPLFSLTDIHQWMKYIYQMKVVPHALPEINPTIDLQVIASTLPTDFLKMRKVFTARTRRLLETEAGIRLFFSLIPITDGIINLDFATS